MSLDLLRLLCRVHRVSRPAWLRASAEVDSHFLYRGIRGIVTVHKPNGDTITVIEVDRVCNLAGLTPPDLDQFWGD